MTHSEQCKVLAQQLRCALDTYEASFSAWAATPSLLDFSRVEAKLQMLRMLRFLLPQVSHEMADVFTAHANLGTMHIRDKTGAFGKQHSEGELVIARNLHSTAIDAVRRHCVGLLSESDAHAFSHSGDGSGCLTR